jgi:hypothetical protein
MNGLVTATDSAKSVTRKHSRLTAHVKSIVLKIGSSHCINHMHALVVKKIPLNLQNVLSEAVKIVNFIKSEAVN